MKIWWKAEGKNNRIKRTINGFEKRKGELIDTFKSWIICVCVYVCSKTGPEHEGQGETQERGRTLQTGRGQG